MHPEEMKPLFDPLEAKTLECLEKRKDNMAVFLTRAPAANASFFSFSGAQDALIMEYALDKLDYYIRWIRHFDGNSFDNESLSGKIHGAKLVVGFGSLSRPSREVLHTVSQTPGAQLWWVPHFRYPDEIKTLQSFALECNNNNNNNVEGFKIKWIAKTNHHKLHLNKEFGISDQDIILLPWAPFVSSYDTDRHLRSTINRMSESKDNLIKRDALLKMHQERKKRILSSDNISPHGSLILHETVRVLKRNSDESSSSNVDDLITVPLRPLSFLHFIGYSQHRNTIANVLAVQSLMRKYPQTTGQLFIKYTRMKKNMMCPEGRLPIPESDHLFLQDCMKQWAAVNRMVIMPEEHIDNDLKAQVYEHCTFAMCCSGPEDSGHLILEAVAFGCVVVTTDCTMHRELLQSAPWVIWVKSTNGTLIPDVCDIVTAMDAWMIARNLITKEGIKQAFDCGLFSSKYAKGNTWMNTRLETFVKALQDQSS